MSCQNGCSCTRTKADFRSPIGGQLLKDGYCSNADCGHSFDDHSEPGGGASAITADLEKFWTYVVTGKVDVEITRFAGLAASPSETDIKTLSFQGHLDDTRGCAKWGPSFAFSQLVERAEYVRCWEDIHKKPDLKFVLLRGTKGIGKSVFIYWLIYKLVKEALDNGSTFPSILLITHGDTHGKKYELLTMVNNKPVVRMADGRTRADYTLSDIEYDPQVSTTYWNLNVVSYGAKSEPKVFQGVVEDAGAARGLKLLMSPCHLEEIQAMLGPVHASDANFSYTVFGGSARMANLLNMKATLADTALCGVVEVELRLYLEGSEYADKNDLIVQAARVIAESVSDMQAQGKTEASQVAAVRHSLFEHRYFEVTDTDGNGLVRRGFASTFMSMLAATLVQHEELSVLKELRNILTNGGFGELFEAQVHKTLYEKFTSGGVLRLTQLFRSGYTRTASDHEHEDLNVIVTRKVFIRTVHDIQRLRVNEYGMPIVPNFSLVDAVIKADKPPRGLEFQVTVAPSHKGATGKHQDIEDCMGTPSAANKMIFCLGKDNFDDFKYVDGLVPAVKQYKMLCEWEANPRGGKRLKSGKHE